MPERQRPLFTGDAELGSRSLWSSPPQDSVRPLVFDSLDRAQSVKPESLRPRSQPPLRESVRAEASVRGVPLSLPPPPRLPSLSPPGFSLPPAAPLAERIDPVPGSRSLLPRADERAEALWQEQREAFAQAALEMASARQRALFTLEGQLLDLAVEIARVLVEGELESRPELHRVLVRSALTSLGHPDKAVLRASADAYEALLGLLGDSQGNIEGVDVEIQLDASLQGLGCIAETPEAQVDGRLGERLRALRQSMDDQRRHRWQEEEG